jgi:hypothetical protein
VRVCHAIAVQYVQCQIITRDLSYVRVIDVHSLRLGKDIQTCFEVSSLFRFVTDIPHFCPYTSIQFTHSSGVYEDRHSADRQKIEFL